MWFSALIFVRSRAGILIFVGRCYVEAALGVCIGIARTGHAWRLGTDTWV